MSGWWPPSWPSELPVYPLLDGFGYQPKNALIASSIPTSSPSVRRVTTGSVETVRMVYILTESQRVSFMDWFIDTIGQGTLSFFHTHPLTDQMAVMKIKPGSLPVWTKPSPTLWRVELDLDILPR